jgi:1-acyl-sn-glycerol-3-phosphate acyltransferase
MDEWHYDPAEDFDAAPARRLLGWRCRPGPLVRGVRLLAAVVVRCWLRLYHRLTIVGQENLPSDRSFLLIANHASHLDTLCLLAAQPVRRLNRAFPVAARDYFCSSAPRALLAATFVNVLPLERHLFPWQSLSLCAHLLQEPTTTLILFPEGTRAGGPEVGAFKPGVALLAAGRDIPVVPCHLAGTHAALPRGAWLSRPRAVRLTIGTPRVYAHLPPTRESARQICRELRQAVMRLGGARPEADRVGRVEAPVL